MSDRARARGRRGLARAGASGGPEGARRRVDRAPANRPWRRAWGGGGLLLGLLLGCPGPEGDGDASEAALRASAPASVAPDPEFRRRAHAAALAALRQAALPALRELDPVAAAEVEGTPLHPPRFGAASRAALREALDEAKRQAEGISPELLSPEDGVVLRVLAHALERGRHRLERPPWRDDPGALVDAVEPYLHALRRRVAAGQCDDGCGLSELGPALEAGAQELGAASPAALAAAREDLAALRRTLPGPCGATGGGGSAEHPLAAACPGLAAALERVDARLARGAATLATAPERPWDEPVAPAEPEAWLRRPDRWSVGLLRRTMEHAEAYGKPPEPLFERAELTVARLRAMLERDAARGKAPGGGRPTHAGPPATTREPALARPFDAAACEAAWTPLRAWVGAQAPHLAAELDCAAAPWSLPAEADDVAIVRHLLRQGVVEPTRRASVAATGVDVALVRGRAAPLAQGLVLEIAIASGSGRHAAMQHALQEAHHRACLAAAAVWIHGQLGDDARLRARLDAHACGELEPLVAAAEARPRAALRGLGLLLIGDGPADAAALDRYFWAPLGLVHDLAMPPPPPAEGERGATIEALGSSDAAR